jgi:hypothetical protein
MSKYTVGMKVEVLSQDGWKRGTVHKEITDHKLTGHASGDVIVTTSWVVWLEEGKWWRTDNAEHLRLPGSGPVVRSLTLDDEPFEALLMILEAAETHGHRLLSYSKSADISFHMGREQAKQLSIELVGRVAMLKMRLKS